VAQERIVRVFVRLDNGLGEKLDTMFRDFVEKVTLAEEESLRAKLEVFQIPYKTTGCSKSGSKLISSFSSHFN
jgi:hypothetical protein